MYPRKRKAVRITVQTLISFVWHPLNLSGGELGDSLGALRDGVLGKLTGEHEPDGGLDLPGGEGCLLVVLGELSGLSGDTLEDVVDERVHD